MLEGIFSNNQISVFYLPYVVSNPCLLLWATKGDFLETDGVVYFIASFSDNESQWCLTLSFFLKKNQFY